MNKGMEHTKRIGFKDIKSLLSLTLIMLVLILSACGQESSQNEVLVSGDTLSAPLPSALLTVDETNLVVAVVVDGGVPQPCANLSVDQDNGTYSCNITLSGGQHTISLVFSIIDATYGTVQVATASGIDVDVVPGQTTSADFSTATLTYDDTDGDNFSNLLELQANTDPFDQNSIPSSITTVINLVNNFPLQSTSTAGIAVDGNTIYITNTSNAEMDTYSTSGTFIATIPLVGVTTYLGGYTGAVTQGAGRLYLTAMYDSNRSFAIYLFDTAGQFISNTIFPGLQNSTGIGYDGTNAFVNQNDTPLHLYRLNPVNGVVLDDFASNPNHGQRLGVDYWADGNVLIESYDNGISTLDPSTGVEIQHFSATDLGYDAQTTGVAVQGDTLYLLTSNTVYVYTLNILF